MAGSRPPQRVLDLDGTDGITVAGEVPDLAPLYRSHRVLAVPRVAVLDDGPQRIVFVHRGDEFVPVVVETGVEADGFVEILAGIEEGDVVVTNGNFQLKSRMYEDVLARGHGH